MENRFKLADGYIDSLKPLTYLYNKTWTDNSTCLLHAPRDVDKSSLAMDIAVQLTEREIPVFYLTTNRLSDDLIYKTVGNNRLYIHQSEFAAADDPADYADIVFKDIEDAIAATGVNTFIIDSLTRVAALSFGRNASPTYLMKRLVALQMRHKISILVVAHDTTKGGTRALLNLADSEIIPQEKSEISELSESSELSECSKVSEPSPSTPTKKPSPFISSKSYEARMFDDPSSRFWNSDNGIYID